MRVSVDFLTFPLLRKKKYKSRFRASYFDPPKNDLSVAIKIYVFYQESLPSLPTITMLHKFIIKMYSLMLSYIHTVIFEYN